MKTLPPTLWWTRFTTILSSSCSKMWRESSSIRTSSWAGSPGSRTKELTVATDFLKFLVKTPTSSFSPTTVTFCEKKETHRFKATHAWHYSRRPWLKRNTLPTSLIFCIWGPSMLMGSTKINLKWSKGKIKYSDLKIMKRSTWQQTTK